MLIFNILILTLTFGDFLALHDINNDYVSSDVLNAFEVSTSTPLPEWVATEGEWNLVTISFVARVLFLLLNIYLIWIVFRKLKKENMPT